jgi:hypothetical protein
VQQQDTESIHSAIETTRFTLYIDKIFKLVAPKLQIHFTKPDDMLNRVRSVTRLGDAKEFVATDTVYFDETIVIETENSTGSC